MKNDLSKYIVEKNNEYYFYDELWTELIGPYKTTEKARETFKIYCKRLG